MTLLYFVLILGITVTIHEFGHFLFAKKAGIYVYEFSIGMGPRLFKFNRKNDETEYSIRLLPIGGYVQMAGEEVEVDENIPVEKRMQSKTWLQRFLTVAAGVMFNFILCFVLLVGIGIFAGSSDNKYRIAEVEKGSAAEKAGFKAGDKFVSINGKSTPTADLFAIELTVNEGKTLTVEIIRDGEEKTIKVKPEKIVDGDVTSYKYGFSLKTGEYKGVLAPFKYAVNKTWSLLRQMGRTILYLVTGKISLNNLSGPVGIYTIVGQTAEAGFINLVYLLALISLNVGFMNLLPIPAFDGGRLLFMVIEKIKGKPVDPKIENTIHNIGLILLMILMFLITINDILRIIKG